MNTFKKVLIELIADSRLYFYDCKNTTFIKYTKLKQKNTFLKNLARLHCQKLVFHNLASLMWGITFVFAKKTVFFAIFSSIYEFNNSQICISRIKNLIRRGR